MAEPKTRLTGSPVSAFLDAIPSAQVREDCQAIAAIMKAASGDEPKMWGPAIVGFGLHRQVYANGKEADWMQIGFSPRKNNIVLYLMLGGFEQHEELMSKLGTHSCGKGCLYIKRLADVHMPTLKKLVQAAVKSRK